MKLLSCALLLAATLLAGCSEASTDGADLYRRYCAACHGADLSGGTGPALGARSGAGALTDAELGAAITGGIGDMAAVERLGTPQVEAVVAYLREFEAR
jgi:mono/diheme cytochrome c family protein